MNNRINLRIFGHQLMAAVGNLRPPQNDVELRLEKLQFGCQPERLLDIPDVTGEGDDIGMFASPESTSTFSGRSLTVCSRMIVSRPLISAQAAAMQGSASDEWM